MHRSVPMRTRSGSGTVTVRFDPVEYPVSLRGGQSVEVGRSRGVYSSSLIARAEPFAGFLGVRCSALSDVLLSFEQGEEFVAVERRELDAVPKRAPDELAPTVEPASLPRVVYPFEERLGEFELHCGEVVSTVVVCGCFRTIGILRWSYR